MERKLVQYFRVITSIVFIFSAIAKVVSLTFFDGMVAELLLGKEYYNHPNSLYYIQIFTRLLISGELFLGAALLQTKYLKTLILPALQLMLIAFTAHLFYVSFGYMAEGKTFKEAFLEGNCGCFGDIMPMNNFESIGKNILSMIMIGYLWLKIGNYDRRDIRFNSLTLPFIIGFVTLGSLYLTVKKYHKKKDIKVITYREEIIKVGTDSLPTIIDTTTSNDTVSVPKEKIKNTQATNSQKSTSPQKDKVQPKETSSPVTTTPKTLTYSEVLDKYINYSSNVTTNLNKGDKLICMFSLSCGHCQETYKAICDLSDSGKLPNTLLLVYGSDFELNHFFNQAGCKHPYIKIDDYNEFKVLLNGHDFPYVLARKSGVNNQTWDLENKDIGKGIADFYGIEKPKEQNDSPFGNPEEGNGLGW